MHSLLVYGNTVNFYVDSVTLLNSLISSRSFLFFFLDSLEFCIWTILSPVNRNTFIFSPCHLGAFYFFSCFIVWARTSSAMLSGSGESGILALFPVLGEKHQSFKAECAISYRFFVGFYFFCKILSI